MPNRLDLPAPSTTPTMSLLAHQAEIGCDVLLAAPASKLRLHPELQK